MMMYWKINDDYVNDEIVVVAVVVVPAAML